MLKILSFKPYLLISLFVFCNVSTAKIEGRSSTKPSVLFINIDDLNDWNEVLGGHPQAITPNLKRLAQQGSTFTRSIPSSPVCFPSRTALFSGIHSSRSGAISNFNWGKHWRFYVPDAITLPKHLNNNGWQTAGGGKNFHGNAKTEFDHFIGLGGDPKPIPGTEYIAGAFGWGESSVPLEKMSDYKTVSWGIKQLNNAKTAEPLFLSIGIYKPHVKWILPKQYFDKYPLDTFQVPKQIEHDLADIPERFKLLAHNEAKFDKGYHQKLVKDGQDKAFARAYLASVTFADEQLGRILDAWEASSHSKNGIIVLWSDHGFMLGEKEGWGKFKPWFDAIHTNMIFVGDGIPKGKFYDSAVSLQDLYPTVLDLVDLPHPNSHKLDGKSLKPLFEKPNMSWDKPVVMSHEEDGIRYDVVMNNQYRMTKAITGEVELYDLDRDQHEWHNLATDSKYQPVINALSQHLTFQYSKLPQDGWLEAEALPRQSSADFGRRGNFIYHLDQDKFSAGRALQAELRKGEKSYIEFVVDVKQTGNYQFAADVNTPRGKFSFAVADVINSQVQASADAEMNVLAEFDVAQLKASKGKVKLGSFNFKSTGLKLLRFTALDKKSKLLTIDRVQVKQG